MTIRVWLFAAAALLVAGAAAAQVSPYKVGDAVELNANGEHWQKCVVTDPGDIYRVLRMQCEAYSGPGYSRGAGIFTETYNSTAVRRARPAAAQGAAAARPASPPAAARAPTPVSAGGYTVGQKVEIEASGHWVPCTVSDIQAYAGLEPLIRVQCPAYPALSRAAGTYVVHNNQTGIRPATGRTGPAPRPAPPARPAPAGPGSALKVGEYACYGSGGRAMIGLSFKVLPGGAYTDLDGKSRGTYAVAAGTVRFKGGHLDGQSGRELDAKGQFRIGAMASCEPW